MKKATAIQQMNNLYGDSVLNNKNTCFANINKSKDVWWFDISLKRLETGEELNLLTYNHRLNCNSQDFI